MTQAKNKNNWWRPSKMPWFIEAFKQVIENNEFDIVILTDEELLMECNDRLEDDKKVAERTFQSWKSGEVESEDYNEFLRLYKKALANQRRQLFKKFENNEWQWQKYAWIIERKFTEWNLRILSEWKNETKLSWELNINNILSDLQWLNKKD